MRYQIFYQFSPETMNQNQQLKVNNPSPNDPTWDVNNAAMKDVLDICLEHIFKHLGAQDLFNMALVSMDFRTTAETEFRRKFGTATFELRVSESLFDNDTFRITKFDDVLDEITLIEPLKRLRFCAFLVPLFLQLKWLINLRWTLQWNPSKCELGITFHPIVSRPTATLFAILHFSSAKCTKSKWGISVPSAERKREIWKRFNKNFLVIVIQ